MDGARGDGAADDRRTCAILGLQLCSAIGYLHRRGRLHLDLKPSNVISDGGTRASSTSTSLAVRVACRGARDRAVPGARAGARRRAWTPRPTSGASGPTLFAAATAKRPFDASGAEQLERRAEPLRRVRRGLPKPFADVVDACLEPATADRPSVEDLEAELDAL